MQPKFEIAWVRCKDHFHAIALIDGMPVSMSDQLASAEEAAKEAERGYIELVTQLPPDVEITMIGELVLPD